MKHPTPEDLQSYARRTLATDELLAVDDHLAGCAECRRIAASGVSTRESLRRTIDAVRGEHVSYESMERYVKRQISSDERDAVAAHAATCLACAAELEDLDDFRQGDVRAAWRWQAIAAAVAAALLLTLVVVWMRDRAADRRGERVAVQSEPRVEPPTRPGEAPAPAPSPRDPMDALSPPLRRVAASLASGELASAALLSSLHPPPEGQRTGRKAGDVAIHVLEPAGAVVESDRPTFRWRGAKHPVTVQIYDRTYALIAESPRLDGTSWRTPSALRRGETYRWQLRVDMADGASVTVPAPPDPPALFHVVDAQSLAELEAARRSASPLEAGLIAIRAGLVDEGAEALSSYAAQHPESPAAKELAKKAAAIAKSQRERTAPSSRGD